MVQANTFMDWSIRKVELTGSTNDDARIAAEAGEPHGLVIQAIRQQSARGRQGRVWEAPEGNIYASILLRGDFDPATIGQMSFVTALALYSTVQQALPNAAIKLKWPNDVLVDGKKISGILLEAGQDFLVVGIGLNVKLHPDKANYPTTSLHALGATALSVDDALRSLLSHFAKWLVCYQQDGFSAIRSAWLDRALRGSMTARLPHETIVGVFMDIDLSGRLRLQLADGTERLIVTGDVFPTA